MQHYPDHLYCPKLDCSAHNMAALLYSQLCNTVTHVPARPGYVLLQQPFIFNIVEKQRCRKVNVELLSGKNRLLSLGGLGTATQEDRLVPFPGRKSSVLNLLQTAEKWVNTSDRASLYDEFPLHDSMILSNESLFILKVEHCKRHFPPWCIHHPLVRVPSSQTEPRSH